MDLRDGDADAFAALYRRYERPLLAFFYRRTGAAELAADLTAETFAAAFMGRASFRPGAAVDAWLFGIAQHKLIDSVQRVSRGLGRLRQLLGADRGSA